MLADGFTTKPIKVGCKCRKCGAEVFFVLAASTADSREVIRVRVQWLARDHRAVCPGTVVLDLGLS